MAHVSLMTEAELKDWILRRLGAPFLKVELTQGHLDDIVEESLRWFSAKKGLVKLSLLTTQAGVTEYDLPHDADMILNVNFSLSPLDIAMVYEPYLLEGDSLPFDVFASPESGGLYSSLVQSLQYIETAKRVLGGEPEWRQIGRKLRIWPAPKQGSSVMLEYKSNHITLQDLSERDHDLIKRFALAQAKEDVARVRSKYDSYPTAQGSVSLDGDRLFDEAQREKEKLEEEIFDSAMPMAFITG